MVADLVAFVRTNKDNDLADHPAWEKLTQANAHRLNPTEERQYDVVGVPELAAEKPSDETVTQLHRSLAIASSIGSVCELPAISKFFNGNGRAGSLRASRRSQPRSASLFDSFRARDPVRLSPVPDRQRRADIQGFWRPTA